MQGEIEEIVGVSALESAVIATAPNRVLWTDDGVGAFALTHRLGVRRIWTQAAFGWLAREGRIAADRYARLSARLIGWGYRFTSANDRVFCAAGTLADWDSRSSPLLQAVEYLALSEVRPQDALPLAAFLIRDAYHHTVLPERRRAVLIDVLNSLSRRPDLNERAFDELGNALPRVFGLNPVGCSDAVQTFVAWRAGKGPILRP